MSDVRDMKKGRILRPYRCFGGGEGTCTPVPPYGQMPFYACSLRFDFPCRKSANKLIDKVMRF